MKRTLLSFVMLAAVLTSYAQTNLIKNGDFEEWSWGNIKEWSKFMSCDVSKSSDAHNGDYSAALAADDFSYNLAYVSSTYFAMEAGKPYTFTMHYKVESGTISTFEAYLRDQTPIFPEEIVSKDITDFNTNWTKVEFTYTPTKAYSQVDFVISFRSVGDAVVLVDNASVVEGATSGIGNNQAEQTINVYPNPSSDYITVDTDVDAVDFYNLEGKLVKHVDMKSASDKTINITSIANGVYVIKLNKDGKVSHTKFTKK